jgi:hypothetical protein
MNRIGIGSHPIQLRENSDEPNTYFAGTLHLVNYFAHTTQRDLSEKEPNWKELHGSASPTSVCLFILMYSTIFSSENMYYTCFGPTFISRMIGE